ncbi:MAG: rhomboid family intramembrane serine protease [bacterium]
MIPLKDNIPSRTYPVVTIGLIVVNSLAWFYELSLGPYLNKFLAVWGMVPAKYFYLGRVESAAFSDRYLPILTSMFLHGGWLHVIGNMFYLWIFGDNVEDRMGHVKFFVFYLLCGVASSFAHIYTNASSPVPTIGASGAVAGVMGAYFLLYPRARVITLVPVFFFIQFVEVPAIFFLGFWVLMQFLNGLISLPMRSGAYGGIAWWAHVGGFAAGMALAPILKRRRRYIDIYVDRRPPWWR